MHLKRTINITKYLQQSSKHLSKLSTQLRFLQPSNNHTTIRTVLVLVPLIANNLKTTNSYFHQFTSNIILCILVLFINNIQYLDKPI